MFGQDGYLKNRISDTELKQIKDKGLVDCNLLELTKEKVTIIEFWETWCAPCIEAMLHLKKIKENFSDELEIVCISSDDLQKTITFIEENEFPFTFIYDKEKYLKGQVFPHKAIPHTTLVDKTGKIHSSTLPGFITEKVINDLIDNKQIDIPNIQLFKPENLSEEKSENTLINFELHSYQLGDRGYLQIVNSTSPKRILTDYTGGFKDTIENIVKITAANKSILELYQYAFENIPLTRFIYDEELNYLNSHLPNHRYTMIFSSSDLLGDHHSILINQLNSTFGFKIKTQYKEVEVLILDSINTNTGNNKKSHDNTRAGMSSKIAHFLYYIIKSSYINPMTITKTLEDFFMMSVETEIPSNSFYDIEIEIERDYIEGITDNVDTWLELLNESGLILRKDKKVLKFIEIEKSIEY